MLCPLTSATLLHLQTFPYLEGQSQLALNSRLSYRNNRLIASGKLWHLSISFCITLSGRVFVHDVPRSAFL